MEKIGAIREGKGAGTASTMWALSGIRFITASSAMNGRIKKKPSSGVYKEITFFEPHRNIVLTYCGTEIALISKSPSCSAEYLAFFAVNPSTSLRINRKDHNEKRKAEPLKINRS